MAQIGSVYQTETTLQTHTGNLTYNTKFTVLGSAFDDSTEYIMWVIAQVSGDATNGRFKFQTQIGGVTPEGAEMIVEPANFGSTPFHTYTFFHKFTTASTAADVIFQIAPHQNTGDEARADTIILLALKLADLDSADWFFAEDTTDGDHTTVSTWGDQASITFTPANTNDDWLVVAWGSVHINNTGKQFRYRISESVSGELEPLMSQEGEDTSDEWPWMLCRPYTLTAAEHIIKIQSNDDSATGAENQHNISKIFALRLNAFEQHAISWDGGTFNTPNTSFNELAAVSFTPDTTGNGVAIGSAVCLAASAIRQMALRIQVGGTTVVTGSDSLFGTIAFDDDDLNPQPVIARFPVTGSSVADVDIDTAVNNIGADVVDAGFAAWSLELAAAGGGPIVNVPLKAFTYADFIPTIETGVNVDVPLRTFTFAPLLPTVETGVNVDVPVRAFTFADFIPTLETGVGISPPARAFTLATFTPTIETGVNVDVPVRAFTLANFAPNVNTPDVQVPVKAFTLATFIPAVETGVMVEAPLRTFGLATFAPTIETGVDIAPAVTTFTLASHIPAIVITVGDDPTRRRRTHWPAHQD